MPPSPQRAVAITALAFLCSSLAAVLAGPDSVVTFNEIHYHPEDGSAGGEWIEIHNQMVVRVDLSGWSLRGGIDFEFDEGVVIEPGAYLVIAANVEDPTLTGVPEVSGPLVGRLSNGGEEIRLHARHGRLMDRVDYGDEGDWPVGPDGGAATLAKRDPELASEPATGWVASAQIGGSPGVRNFPPGWEPAMTGVVMNEHGSDWVELTNRGPEGVLLMGYSIETSEGQVVVLPDVQLGAGDFHVVPGLLLPPGARVFLKEPGRVADAVVVKNTPRGRRPDGAGPWQYPDAPTPGDVNTFSVSEAVVINEIMYHHRPDYPDESVEVLTINETWKYDQSGTDQGISWREPGFDDATWPSGPGVLGFESSPLPAPIATPLVLGPNTFYFRKTFSYAGDPERAFRLRLLVDDGAVVYLNGSEVHRENMPEGTIGFATPAMAGVGNAAYSSAVTLPAGAILAGANTLAVEVHQRTAGSGDIVFGLELSSQAVFRENDEEWIELHNRSGALVSLSGWSLRDAVQFDFPADTEIPAGGYLVVADDSAALRIKYPSLVIVGDFGGRLNNRDERIKLRDASKNTVDEVHYYDSGGGWPEFADGGGSSLELIDPDADNSVAGAWVDSDESSKAEWKNISYRGIGSEPPGSKNPNNFHEFLMGLLSAGEVLVDDITVTLDPDGAALDLIQNGTFSAGTDKWRILGTQQGEAINDPGGTGSVLRLRADGAISHTYNTASTTFANRRTTNSAATYEISLRAKWVTGSPQLNTRLYLNRLARTHILPLPEKHGTPGAPNSRLVSNAGPTYRGFAHAPLVPGSGEAVTVSVMADDRDGLSSVRLYYAVEGGSWQSVVMILNVAEGLFTGTIPGQSDREVVQFYIRGQDSAGAVSHFPKGGPESRALYRVGGDGASSAVHTIRIIMTPEEADLLHTEIHAVSNHRYGATVIYNDREVVYGAGVRLRGAPFSRRGTRTGWNIRLGSRHALRGVHSSVSLDGGYSNPRGDGTGWVQVGAGVASNELIYNQIANYSGGIGASYDDIAFVDAPKENQDKMVQLKMARFGRIYLDSVFENGADGALFKQELIYHPTGTVDGDPESFKLPYSAVKQVDITSMGGTGDPYRFNYLRSNLRERDDYDGIIAMCEAFDLTDPEARRIALEEAIDMDEFMRNFAFTALTCTADTYNQSLAHNLEFYVRPEDNKVLALPWDVDHAFYYGTDANIFGQGSHRLAAIIQIPQFRRRYLGHLVDICNRGFKTVYVREWVTHFNAVAQQTAVNNYTTWINRRRRFVLGQVSAEQPELPFAITTNNGNDFTVADPTAELSGNGWVDVREIRLASTGDALAVRWLDGDSWVLTVPLTVGVNSLSLTAHNHQGVQVGADAITITNSGGVVSPSDSNLVVSELMYHPADPSAAELAAGFSDQDEFEFIEFTNIGANPIALAGLHFIEGITFDFTGSSLTELSPGDRMLVVSNSDAFQFRYGSGHPVAGVFINSNLANQGERLRLADGTGTVVRDFTYDDTHPWPEDADGNGYALILIDAASNPDHNLPTSWRASVQIGGSPGGTDDTTLGEWMTANGLSNPDGDDDGDGIINFMLYATGGDLTPTPFAALPTVTLESGLLEFSFRERAGADDVVLTPQVSDDLIDWQVDPGDGSVLTFEGAFSQLDGTRMMRYRLSFAGSNRRFVRVLVQSR